MNLLEMVMIIFRTAGALGQPISRGQIEWVLRMHPDREVLTRLLANLERRGVVRRSAAGHYWEYVEKGPDAMMGGGV